MRKLLVAPILLIALFALAACGGGGQKTQAATSSTVSGTVTYNVTTTLPAGAQVVVQLRSADAGSSGPISQQQITTNGNQPPIPYEITYAPGAINQNNSYVVVGIIQDAAGHVLYKSDSPVPVITKGNPVKDVTVTVVPAPAGVAPAPAPAAQAAGISGMLWGVVSLNGNPPAANTSITAQFNTDGTLTGNDGCNNYSLPYKIDGNKITISPGAATTMACAEPAMTQATNYLAALTAAATFTAKNDDLTLMDAGGQALVNYKVIGQDLAGTAWNAIMYNSGTALTGIQGVQITLAFAGDGTLSGFSGCNNYSGPYTTGSGNTIKIGPLAVTQKSCTQPSNVMKQESAYLAALQSAASYQMQNQQLVIQNASGQMAAQYQRASQ